MAQDIKPFSIVLLQNQNQFSHAYQKYYAQAYNEETLSLRGLLALVGFDQSVYSHDIVQGVISRVTAVMVEQLKRGTPVKWPGLGTFSPTIENVKKGISAEDLKAGKYNPDKYIEGVHITFVPENAKGEKLTSRAFKDLCVLDTAGVKTLYYDEEKNVVASTVTALDQWIANGGSDTAPTGE